MDIESIRTLRIEAELAADLVEDVIEPSLGTRYYRILHGLLMTSRLTEEARRLSRKAEALRQRQEGEEARRARNYRTVVQLLLFVFAYLQGLSFLHAINADDSVVSRGILGAVLLLGVLAVVRLRSET
jgi:hypothetical protein